MSEHLKTYEAKGSQSLSDVEILAKVKHYVANESIIYQNLANGTVDAVLKTHYRGKASMAANIYHFIEELELSR